MSSNRLAQSSIEELVTLFQAIALDQDKALLDDEVSTYNRLYDRMEAVEAELKGRPGDQRRALLPLLAHQNGHVRLKAALAILPIDLELARQALKEIIDAKDFPHAAYASSMLRALEEGRFTPA